MKKPEERKTPGRKRLYVDPVRLTLVLPSEVLELIEQNVSGDSQNRKLVNALTDYVKQNKFPVA